MTPEEIEKKVIEHDVILNNGLKDEVRHFKRWIWAMMAVIIINAIIGRIF